MYRLQVSLFGMADAMKANGRSAFAGVTYGVAASFPLYNGGQQRADQRVANATREREEQEEQRVALKVVEEISAALVTLRTARQNIETAQAALTAAQEEYRVVQVRYLAGRSIVTEVLDAQAAHSGGGEPGAGTLPVRPRAGPIAARRRRAEPIR